MPWNISVVMIFFALGDVLLVSTEPVRTAIIQIGKASVVEGEKVEFKCVISSVHGEQPENKESNWFHLYKNREKISSLPEPRGTGAVTFIKQDIKKNDAGDYTCMYGNENPGDLTNISHGSSDYLNVQESRYQLLLQLDKHNQMEGMDVSFKCMIPSELRDATGKEGFLHLYKNGSLVDSQAVLKVPDITFSIKNVTRNDTGNYTCVYGEEKLVNSTNSKRSRPVYLHVTGDMTTPTTSIKTQQTNETGDMTTPTTSIKTQQTNGIVLYLGAGVGSGVLVLLLLLIGGVLKCLQSKRDPTVQIEPVYTTVNQPKQPSKQQDDTLTYSEINTARVTKKKPSSAPDEDTVTYAAVKTSTY